MGRHIMQMLFAALGALGMSVLAASGEGSGVDRSRRKNVERRQNLHLYEADTALAGTLGTVIITGAITDYGTDHQGCPGDGINRLELSKGSFSINVNDLGGKCASIPVDPRTCSSERLGNRGDPDRFSRAPVRAPPPRHQRHDPRTRAAVAGLVLRRLANGQCDTNATQYPGVLIAHGGWDRLLQVVPPTASSPRPGRTRARERRSHGAAIPAGPPRS